MDKLRGQHALQIANTPTVRSRLVRYRIRVDLTENDHRDWQARPCQSTECQGFEEYAV